MGNTHYNNYYLRNIIFNLEQEIEVKWRNNSKT